MVFFNKKQRKTETPLTEVIFKYVVVMKPTKLGIWFKLGF